MAKKKAMNASGSLATASTSQVKPARPLRIWVEVPETGLELKLLSPTSTNPSEVLGTLRISRNGLSWARANIKRPPPMATFAMLEELVGLVHALDARAKMRG